LPGTTTFGNTLTVKGGDGDDGVFITEDNSTSLQVQFGGKVVLYGGNGMDTLSVKNGAQFESTGNVDDFEISNTLLP
jgi:maltoporin